MSKRIIVIDDDSAILDALAILLEREGYSVILFSTGEPVLNGEFEVPHLFILDMQLPTIDGLEICRYLKGHVATQHVPVLIFSASPQIGELARSVCADDFLEKPFSVREFRKKVETLLSNV